MASLQKGLESPKGQAAVADLDVFAKDKFKILITEVMPVKLAATSAV